MSAMQGLPTNTNFLSPIGFRFMLSNFPEVNYFCQAANLPGLSISGIDVGTPMQNIQYSGDEISFEELNIRFVVDENMKNWMAIHDWIIGLGIPNKEAVEKYIKLKAHDELTTDGTLSILTSNMNVQAEVRFENMFPLSLSGIEFDSSLTDVEYATATVSFRYDLYSINNLLKNETTYEGVPDNRNA